MERTRNDIVVGLIATPVSALIGGAALQFFMHFLNARLDTWLDIVGLGLMYLIFGSLCALPATLIGLPAAGAYITPSGYRQLIMMAVGFILGGLTMLLWAFIFFGLPFFDRLRFGYGVHELAVFLFVGATCGALSGLAMGLVSGQQPKQAGTSYTTTGRI